MFDFSFVGKEFVRLMMIDLMKCCVELEMFFEVVEFVWMEVNEVFEMIVV